MHREVCFSKFINKSFNIYRFCVFCELGSEIILQKEQKKKKTPAGAASTHIRARFIQLFFENLSVSLGSKNQINDMVSLIKQDEIWSIFEEDFSYLEPHFESLIQDKFLVTTAKITYTTG